MGQMLTNCRRLARFCFETASEGVELSDSTATTENEVKTAGIKSSNGGSVVVPVKELHGRKQIFSNVEAITASNVVQVLNKVLVVHNRNRAEEKYLFDYLSGKQPILDRIKQVNGDINNKTVVNIASQIITFKTANFAGEAIQYVSRGSGENVPKMVDKLNSMMLAEGKPSKDMELAHKMFTGGVGYRLVLNDKAKRYVDGDLFDEAPFEIYIPDPFNTFIVRRNDVTKRVLMGVTYVFLDDAQSKVEYTVYTDNATYTIEGTPMSAGNIKNTVTHNFGMVPLIEYPCNPIYMGAFEVVLPLLDAYNLMTSNRLDGIEQFIQALMVFEGVDVTREQFLELKDLGAIKLPPSMDGRSSKVYYLNEQLDQQQTQTLIDNIYDRILQIVGMPSQGNANTSDSSNNGAMVIKSGQWDAQARILETQGMWKAAETEFLKAVLKICEDANVFPTETLPDGKKRPALKVSDVEPKFGIHNYEDRLVKTQSFTTLISAGCPPLQAFTLSGVSKDPEADAIAYEAYQKEQEDDVAAEIDRMAARSRQIGGGEDGIQTDTVSEVPA